MSAAAPRARCPGAVGERITRAVAVVLAIMVVEYLLLFPMIFCLYLGWWPIDAMLLGGLVVGAVCLISLGDRRRRAWGRGPRTTPLPDGEVALIAGWAILLVPTIASRNIREGSAH